MWNLSCGPELLCYGSVSPPAPSPIPFPVGMPLLSNREAGILPAMLVQLTQGKGMAKHNLKLELPTAHMAHSQAWRKPGSRQQNKT